MKGACLAAEMESSILMKLVTTEIQPQMMDVQILVLLLQVILVLPLISFAFYFKSVETQRLRGQKIAMTGIK